jgi:Flp pilus assembly pilin Flp
MTFLRKTYVRLAERKGQAMTEYALILSAVAVVAYLVYQNLGNSIGTLLGTVVGDL